VCVWSCLGGCEMQVLTFLGLNAVSRFCMGWISDYARNRIPRVAWMIGSVILIACSHLLFCIVPSEKMMWLVCICTGCGYGIYKTINNQALSIYFGVARYGLNHGLCMSAAAVGSLFFTSMATLISDASFNSPTIDCTVNALPCFRYAFLFSACMLIVPALGVRPSRLYSSSAFFAFRCKSPFLHLLARVGAAH
jgi:MFS family permease